MPSNKLRSDASPAISVFGCSAPGTTASLTSDTIEESTSGAPVSSSSLSSSDSASSAPEDFFFVLTLEVNLRAYEKIKKMRKRKCEGLLQDSPVAIWSSDQVLQLPVVAASARHLIIC